MSFLIDSSGSDYLDERILSPRVSVIVPIFNVEQYLTVCLDSIVAQSFRDFEVVLVDDCSPDRSMMIADGYVGIDSRFRSVRHDENRGLAAARNSGIKEAKGEFIAFIDSDDWVEVDYLAKLYSAVNDYGADVSACGRYLAHDDDERIILEYDCAPGFANKVLTRSEALRAMNSCNSFDMSMWGKLFKRRLFDGVEFPVRKLSEDYFVCYKLLWKAEIVVYDPAPLYFYRRRSGSITNSTVINKDGLEASKLQLEFVEERCPELRWVGVTAVALSCIGIANACAQRNNSLSAKERVEFLQFIRVELDSIIGNSDLPRIKKAQIACFAFSPSLYAFALRVLKALRNSLPMRHGLFSR